MMENRWGDPPITPTDAILSSYGNDTTLLSVA